MDVQEHLVGEALSSECQVYRIKVLTTFLKSGNPLNKLECFRKLLEENSTTLILKIGPPLKIGPSSKIVSPSKIRRLTLFSSG